mmetsp:Transcript_166603/g.404871  ORF Transcript_166603/g.404871 Transcript_166603/m.404871 type:complete len:230 (+) Transcript_166603:696-1385(+)
MGVSGLCWLSDRNGSLICSCHSKTRCSGPPRKQCLGGILWHALLSESAVQHDLGDLVDGQDVLRDQCCRARCTPGLEQGPAGEVEATSLLHLRQSQAVLAAGWSPLGGLASCVGDAHRSNVCVHGHRLPLPPLGTATRGAAPTWRPVLQALHESSPHVWRHLPRAGLGHFGNLLHHDHVQCLRAQVVVGIADAGISLGKGWRCGKGADAAGRRQGLSKIQRWHLLPGKN